MWVRALGRTFRTGSHVRGIAVTQQSTGMLSICARKYGEPIEHSLPAFYKVGHVKESVWADSECPAAIRVQSIIA